MDMEEELSTSSSSSSSEDEEREQQNNTGQIRLKKNPAHLQYFNQEQKEINQSKRKTRHKKKERQSFVQLPGLTEATR